MAKDPSIPLPNFPNVNPTAPLFSLARTVIDQIDQQTERFIEIGLERAQESAQLYRTARAQAVGVGRTVLGTMEQLATDGIEAAKSIGRPFTKGTV
jgi:hypothetical protein